MIILDTIKNYGIPECLYTDYRIVFKSIKKELTIEEELAIWDERKIYHNSYLRFDNKYHIIKLNNEKSSIFTNKPVKVFQFLDGTKHILFNDTWYDLETISIDKIEVSTQLKNDAPQLKINLSESRKSTNTPWAKWNPNKVF